MDTLHSTGRGSTAVLEPGARPQTPDPAPGYGYDYRAGLSTHGEVYSGADLRPDRLAGAGIPAPRRLAARADGVLVRGDVQVRTGDLVRGGVQVRARTGSGLRVCALLGLFSAAMYEYFLAELPLGMLNPRLSFVSELSARDQPHHRVFEAMDFSSGLLIALLGLALLRALPWGRVRAAGCWSLIAFGLSTTAVGLLPMDCAISASQVCSRDEQLGRLSAVHEAHTVVSVIASTAVIASLVLLGLGLRHQPGWRRAVRFASVGLPVVCALSAVLAALGLGWGLDQVGTVAAQVRDYLGVYERIELLAVAVWVMVLSWCLLDLTRVPALPVHALPVHALPVYAQPVHVLPVHALPVHGGRSSR